MSEDPKWQGERHSFFCINFSSTTRWLIVFHKCKVNLKYTHWNDNVDNFFPVYLDTAYILAHYKTEACKRPPRLCRQGYACPHFHNIRDKRRNPRIYKYRFSSV